jgi:hypothetical protein
MFLLVLNEISLKLPVCIGVFNLESMILISC